jgi:hypothetical protein
MDNTLHGLGKPGDCLGTTARDRRPDEAFVPIPARTLDVIPPS